MNLHGVGFAYAHLSAGIGTAKQDTRGGAGKSGSLARLTEVAEGRDDALDASLLTEASLGRSQQGGNDSNLGIHGDEKWLGLLSQ